MDIILCMSCYIKSKAFNVLDEKMIKIRSIIVFKNVYNVCM